MPGFISGFHITSVYGLAWLEIEALPGNQKLLWPSCLAGGRSAAHRIGRPGLLRWSFRLLAGVTGLLLSPVPVHESAARVHGSITHMGCFNLGC